MRTSNPLGRQLTFVLSLVTLSVLLLSICLTVGGDSIPLAPTILLICAEVVSLAALGGLLAVLRTQAERLKVEVEGVG